ncbi:hypothetical protein [Hallella mizrahii]|uniref:Uncharacterized protein n=1 Tax=Hallella mizrahii TaxID=2606637 RepID=A0A7K0KDX1_9BACT|nr:hypothetical protein [Hallella mizrahii]MST84074.1 hypothetical protein [Hallella mizrahii]
MLITIIALLFIGLVSVAIYIPNLRDSLPDIDGYFNNGVKLSSAHGRQQTWMYCQRASVLII